MKVNDKVRLSKHGTECYGNTNHNPHDKEGIIIAIRTQKNRYASYNCKMGK